MSKFVKKTGIMIPNLSDNNYILLTGDCLSLLKELPNECIDCVITSPPYWAMRIYDNAEDSHEVGNESNYQMYILKLTEIFHEVKRVLKSSGSLWLNLGDKYNNKALMGMPWRVALSLIDDGWVLRNDVIWNQMKGTQSCRDRLRDSYEHIFHFVKCKQYFYDDDAIRIKPTQHPTIGERKTVSATGVSGKKYREQIQNSTELTNEEKQNALRALEETISRIRSGEINDFRMTIRGVQRPWHSDNTKVSGRAKELQEKGFYIMHIGTKGAIPTDIWNIVPEDTWRKDSHFAVFPEELLKIPILATCPLNGWVLDPFSGTGSTVAASLQHGRKGMGIDLSKTYTNIAKERISQISSSSKL